MCHWFFGFPFFMGGFVWIWIIFGVILMIGLLIFIFSRRDCYKSFMYHDHKSHYKDYEDPIEILKRMYIKGEINEEEYEKKRKIIEQ